MTPLLTAGQSLVFEGDSLTHRGMGPSHDTWPFLRIMGWERTWADLASEWLFIHRSDLNLRFNNAAVGGSNIRAVNGRFDSIITAHKPNWVLFTLGTNDPLQGVSEQEFTDGLIAYGERLKALSGGRLVYVHGLHGGPELAWPCPGEHDALRQRYQSAGAAAVRSIGGVAVDAGAYVRPCARALLDRYEGHTIFSDGIHFNAIGAELISTAVLQALGMLGLPPRP